MSKLDERLRRISDLLDRNRTSDADVSFRELLSTTPPAALASQEAALRLLVDRFAHKRRRDLGQALTAVLRNPRVSLDTLALRFRERLDELSAHHLFQWSTFYRDTVDELLHAAESYSASEADREQVVLLVHRAFSRHASDIYGTMSWFSVNWSPGHARIGSGVMVRCRVSSRRTARRARAASSFRS
ncbi:MAG: hypothetical protein ACREK6_15415, partial [Candidatus Rokuibacteriota bacterium]